MKENLKTFIANNRKYLDDEMKKDFTLWQICIEYGIQYQKFVRKEIDISEKQMAEDRFLVLKYAPEKIINYIELFCNLDKEYKDLDMEINSNLLVSAPRRPVKNTSWRGFWMKSTGNDFSLFIGWLKSGIKYDQYKTGSLVDWYMQEWKKKSNQVPLCIRAADEVFQEYFNKK